MLTLKSYNSNIQTRLVEMENVFDYSEKKKN